jgi:hypothetical protein
MTAMIRIPVFLLLAASLGFAGGGCTSPTEPPDYYPPLPPTGVVTETGDDFIEIFWNDNPEYDLAGYRVYVAPRYEGPYQLIGTTQAPYFSDGGARNGNLYYYAVTAFDENGNESGYSTDVAYDIPRPEGYNVPLSERAVSPASCAYDFSDYIVVSINDNLADMWYEYAGGQYTMRVDNDADIQDLGPTSSILDIRVAPTTGWSPTKSVSLRPGRTYCVWTWDNHFAKFRVSQLGRNSVVFDWAYQLVPGETLFKPVPRGGVRQEVASGRAAGAGLALTTTR